MHNSKTLRHMLPALAICALLLVGCDDDTKASLQEDRPHPPLETQSGEVLRLERRADDQMIVVTAAGDEVLVAHGEAVVGDAIVVVGRDGIAKVHRTPSAIIEETNRQPTWYLKTGTHEPVIADGFRGAAYVDPTDGEVCWIALMCVADGCATAGEDGGVPRFIWPLADANVAADGRLTFAAGSAHTQALPKCPHCGQEATVQRYESPAVAARREQLKSELAAVRTARNERAR